MWAWDAPSGTYQNHFMSSKIREQAAADTVILRFMNPEKGFGKGKGATANITRILQLPIAAKVSEQDRLPSGRPAISTKSVTVSEWGYKCELTEFEENLTHYNMRNPFQRMLRDQMRLTMDSMAATALKTAVIKGVPTSASAMTFETDSATFSGTATVNLTIAHLRDIHDYLRQNLKAPPYRNGKYVGILSTRAARGIKNDDEYKDWQAPTTSEPFMTGRLKDVEGFALFETNADDSLDDTMGTNNVLGECLFFGADAGFLATVQEPQIRAGIPEDLGRFREFGWVGTLEAGIVWDTASTSRIVHVGSA